MISEKPTSSPNEIARVAYQIIGSVCGKTTYRETSGRAVMERKRTNAAKAAAPQPRRCSEKLTGSGI
jgi:hypothetical protein